jgi:DNA (cytosine-5)-methyltransferase 1
MKPRLLDLFCGAGGAAMGYHRAGFEVVGVDIATQPHYPFEFHQADALEFLARHGRDFDAIHASPPCQGYSRMRHLRWLQDRPYQLLIPAVRDALAATGKIWVIENVADAPLDGAVLCGLALGMNLLRHRRFASNILLLFPCCPGRHPVLYAGAKQMGERGRRGGVMGVAPGCDPRVALEIDWMSLREMRQAIPPRYTQLIGQQLMQALQL